MNELYDQKVKKTSPDSPLALDCLKAFLSGGTICLIGETLFSVFSHFGAEEKNAATYVSVVLIAVTAALTGLGLFSKLAKHAGAGTLVPITGFANAVTAPAIEYVTEGKITGTAVKMFTISGPVIVYGCAAASLYGAIYYFFCR